MCCERILLLKGCAWIYNSDEILNLIWSDPLLNEFSNMFKGTNVILLKTIQIFAYGLTTL